MTWDWCKAKLFPLCFVLHTSPQWKCKQQQRDRSLMVKNDWAAVKIIGAKRRRVRILSDAFLWRKLTPHADFYAVWRSLCLCWRRKRLKKMLIILSEASCFISVLQAAITLGGMYRSCMLFLGTCFVFFFSNLRKMWMLIEVRRLTVCAAVGPSGGRHLWKLPPTALPAYVP